jgi:nucleotide-binding universal stress UspA family protein
MKAIEWILVPTDFSECAGAAAEQAAQLAKQLGAAIEVVTVVDTSPLLEAYGDVDYRNERIAYIRGQARQQLEAFARKHFAGLERVRQDVRDGNTFLEILQAAHDTGSDLIVLGTHGRTGLAHLLIGSTAEKVVRKSPVPVLTVRARQPSAGGSSRTLRGRTPCSREGEERGIRCVPSRIAADAATRPLLPPWPTTEGPRMPPCPFCEMSRQRTAAPSASKSSAPLPTPCA